MAGMARSLQPPPLDPQCPGIPPAGLAGQVTAQLQRLKWSCWHGNVFRALQTTGDLIFDPEHARRLGAAVLLEPRERPSGWRSIVSSPVAGEVALWQLKR